MTPMTTISAAQDSRGFSRLAVALAIAACLCSTVSPAMAEDSPKTYLQIVTLDNGYILLFEYQKESNNIYLPTSIQNNGWYFMDYLVKNHDLSRLQDREYRMQVEKELTDYVNQWLGLTSVFRVSVSIQLPKP